MATLTPKQEGWKPNEQQKKFISAFKGNIEEAAEAAGYSYGYARKMMVTNGNMVGAIEDRSDKENAPLIASRQRRQEFWTGVMEDKGAEMKDRLSASNLLGKSEADFTEKVEQSGPGGGPIENKWTVEIIKPGGK